MDTRIEGLFWLGNTDGKAELFEHVIPVISIYAAQFAFHDRTIRLKDFDFKIRGLIILIDHIHPPFWPLYSA